MDSSPRGGHFLGALVSKVTPPVVQVTLLWLVAHEGSLSDVGKLALASALGFGLGAIGDLGFSTSLSVPATYFGSSHPPLRATRAVRVSAACGATCLYVLFWMVGLGGHDWSLLLASPLPLILSLGFGYSGAMNASGALSREGRITVAESLLIVVLALILIRLTGPLEAALLALSIGRGAGTVARAAVLHTLPTSDTPISRSKVANQARFGASTIALVVHGQSDMVALGALGEFDQLGVYSPLLRTAYSTVLVAEALAWSLYGRAGDRTARDPTSRGRPFTLPWVVGHWRITGLLIGLSMTAVFFVAAEPVVRFVLDEPIQDLSIPALILCGGIVLSFAGFIQSVDIIRSGRQAARIPVALVSAAVTVAGVAVAAEAESLAGLAAARLASEAVIVLGYQRIVRSIS